MEAKPIRVDCYWCITCFSCSMLCEGFNLHFLNENCCSRGRSRWCETGTRTRPNSPTRRLTVIVNTGDDFEHLGLYISPDLDTVCYTLAGLSNPETGWGRINGTFNAIANIEKLGGATWFRLGDQDLATHIERTRRKKAGQSLSQITNDFCKAWGIHQTVIPMSDDLVRTIVNTDEGELAFQEYFVHRRCEPRVKGFRFNGIESAKPAPGIVDAIKEADAVVICPSNPGVSIAPILAVSQTPIQLRHFLRKWGEARKRFARLPHHRRTSRQRSRREDVPRTGN